MISSIVSRLVILVFGTLYPAYASYKAVRSRDVREYVKWMMYWIVFALFTCGETITDVFLSFWFPFYYEIKIGFVLWLLSPATKGSSILYRKFVHPMLTNREQEIDEYIARAKEQGYHTVLHLGSKGVNYATNVIMQTAIKGGGGLVNQLRKSYSLSDLTEGEGEPVGDVNRNGKDVDSLEYRGNRRPDRVDGPRTSNRARGYSPRRSASGSARMEMYFPEVDLDVRQRRGSSRSRETSVPLSHIRSSEDVSSGYTSGDHFYEDAVQMDVDQTPEDSVPLTPGEGPLVRTASVGSTRSTRTKGSASVRAGATSTTSTVAKKATQGEDVEESSSEEEDFWSDPLDHISPHLDRTLFVNDLNTFPIHQPQLAAEFVSGSPEVPRISIDAGNTHLNSICIDKQSKAEVDKVIKSLPIEFMDLSGDISCSESPKKSDGLNHVPETINGDLHVKSLLVSPDDSSPPCPSLGERNSKSLNESVPHLGSEEKNVEIDIKQALTVPTEESTIAEIPFIPHSTTLESKIMVSKEGDKESLSAVVSSTNVTELDPLPISKETEIVSNDYNEPPIRLESTLIPEGITSVIIEQTQTKCNDLDDASNVSAAACKEEDSAVSRGGRYHKRPAPRPPEQEDRPREASAEPEYKCRDTVRARLVLKPGIVRSLPDVGLALSDDSKVQSEVFMAAGASQWSPLSSSSSSHSSPKHNSKGRFLVGISSKGSSSKESVGMGFHRFLNLSGHPHLGSLTSLFPFWHGPTSSGVSAPGRFDEAVIKGGKIPEGNIECKKVASVFDQHKKVGSEDELQGSLKVDNVLKRNASERGRTHSEKHFPVRQMSQSPSRSCTNHRF